MDLQEVIRELANAADVNAVAVVNLGGRTHASRVLGEERVEGDRIEATTTKEGMGMAESEYHRLSREELEKLAGEPLPERAAMSLINANIAAPINAALALNVLSDGSVAYADATQTGDITQST